VLSDIDFEFSDLVNTTGYQVTGFAFPIESVVNPLLALLMPI
jgi:hypothetical protein